MRELSPQLPNRVLRALNSWCENWDTPDIPKTVIFSFSSRLSRTLARCHPLQNRIVVRADLALAPYRLLAEVLCHELAHLATYRLHGPNAKPHGKEWQELVRRAGFEPRIRIQNASAGNVMKKRRISPAIFEHRCHICQIVRVSRRPVLNWRCAACLDAGLEGAMVITRKALPDGNRRDH